MDNEVTMYTADGLDILYHSGMISEEEYLAHHGILGQKWGIRRYQNLDGTLTDYSGYRQIVNNILETNKDLNIADSDEAFAAFKELYSKNRKTFTKDII